MTTTTTHTTVLDLYVDCGMEPTEDEAAWLARHYEAFASTKSGIVAAVHYGDELRLALLTGSGHLVEEEIRFVVDDPDSVRRSTAAAFLAVAAAWLAL